MWHNISSGSVSIEVAISLQHMKLTSGSESVSKQMTANFGRYPLNEVSAGQKGSKSWEIDSDWSVNL